MSYCLPRIPRQWRAYFRGDASTCLCSKGLGLALFCDTRSLHGPSSYTRGIQRCTSHAARLPTCVFSFFFLFFCSLFPYSCVPSLVRSYRTQDGYISAPVLDTCVRAYVRSHEHMQVDTLLVYVFIRMACAGAEWARVKVEALWR